jgi:hypothetical protein
MKFPAEWLSVLLPRCFWRIYFIKRIVHFASRPLSLSHSHVLKWKTQQERGTLARSSRRMAVFSSPSLVQHDGSSAARFNFKARNSTHTHTQVLHDASETLDPVMEAVTTPQNLAGSRPLPSFYTLSKTRFRRRMHARRISLGTSARFLLVRQKKKSHPGQMQMHTKLSHTCHAAAPIGPFPRMRLTDWSCVCLAFALIRRANRMHVTAEIINSNSANGAI